MMNLAPLDLRHGERFGSLTVLRKLPSGKYRCGCICGYSDVKVRANALMRGRVKFCRRCAKDRVSAKGNTKEKI